jgi:hypothetical protein
MHGWQLQLKRGKSGVAVLAYLDELELDEAGLSVRSNEGREGKWRVKGEGRRSEGRQ